MARISRDDALMATAEVWAGRGTCSRLKVGAVFSINGRILAQGYNGAPAGLDHCVHMQYTMGHGGKMPAWLKEAIHKEPGLGVGPAMGRTFFNNNGTITNQMTEHYEGPTCSGSEHAERNGVAWAARKGVCLESSELHVTHMPCLPCSMSVVNAGVKRVVYRNAYRFTEGLELLARAGVEVVDFSAPVA